MNKSSYCLVNNTIMHAAAYVLLSVEDSYFLLGMQISVRWGTLDIGRTANVIMTVADAFVDSSPVSYLTAVCFLISTMLYLLCMSSFISPR